MLHAVYDSDRCYNNIVMLLSWRCCHEMETPFYEVSHLLKMHNDSSIIILRCRCSWHVPNVCTTIHTDSCCRDDLSHILLKYVVTKFKCVNGASFSSSTIHICAFSISNVRPRNGADSCCRDDLRPQYNTDSCTRNDLFPWFFSYVGSRYGANG